MEYSWSAQGRGFPGFGPATLARECVLQRVSGSRVRLGSTLAILHSYVVTGPTRREADDEVIRRSRLLVDTHGGATAQVGGIVQLLASGVLTQGRCRG